MLGMTHLGHSNGLAFGMCSNPREREREGWGHGNIHAIKMQFIREVARVGKEN